MSVRKKRRVPTDLTCRFPMKVSSYKKVLYLRYGALLNLRYVERKIIYKKPTDVITYGFDDTTKATGFRFFDVKTDHITIREMQKETLSNAGQ